MKKLFAIVCVLLLSGCVAQQPRIKETNSGYPEAIFAKSSLAKVRNKLIEVCDTHGIPVLDSNENSVTCGKEMTGSDAVLGQMLIGNSYSTTPIQKIKFTLYQVSKGVKVSARQWFETQMAFGQMQQQEMNGNNQFNSVQNMLTSIGGK